MIRGIMGFQRFGIVMKNRAGALALIAASMSAISFMTIGCTATNDQTSQQGPLKLTLPAEACLKQAIPVIQNYFTGAVAPEDVNTSWSCISGALMKFTTSTRGANPDFYTSRELRSFLETFYLGDIKVSDQLLVEVMRIKQLVLGGADDRLTRLELAQAQSSIQVLQVESLRMLPYIKYVSQTISVDEALQDPAKVEAALTALQTSTTTLGTLFGRGTNGYATEDLESLLTELKPIFKNWSGPEKALSYLPTFNVLKTLVLNPPGNRIAPSEWQPLITNAGHLFAIFLRQHYLMSRENLMTGLGLAELTSTFEELNSILKAGIDAKPARVITYSQIDATIDELIRLNLIPESLRDTTVKSLVRTMFSKLLNPASSGARPKVTGLTQTVLTRIHTQAASFLELQRAWDDLTASAVASDPTLAGKAIPWKTFVSLWSQQTTSYPAAQEDVRQLITLASPISFRDNGTVIFDNRLSYLPVSANAFLRYNWESNATRLLVQGYATDATANRWTGLTQDQIKSFFQDAHDLGVDMQLLEPKDDNLWQTSFSESNMFMVSALNDDFMSYSEVFDYLSYLLGGGKMSERMYSDAKENCAHIGIDGFNRPTMDINCFRGRYGQKFASVHLELPWWVKTQADAGVGGWPAMEQSLEAAARTGGFSQDPISTSDITRMTMVMQYIESLYVRFDGDRNGLIDYNEAQKALPLFKALLASASGFTSDRKINALFMYILKYGKPPTSIVDKIYFQLIWLSSQSKWEAVTADRLKLLNVIAALKSASAKAFVDTAKLALPLPDGVLLPVSPVSQ
jgi:hypothetical protein